MSIREPRGDSPVQQPSARLLAIEARLRAVIEGAQDCIISIDADGRIVEFNPAAERTFGFRRAEMVGRSLAETIVPPAMRAAHTAGMKRYLSTGVSKVSGRRVEMPALRSDGTELLVELTITPPGDEHPPVFTAFLRDITERRRVEDQLRESEARFQELAGAVEDVFYVVESRRIAYISPAYETVFGRTREFAYANPRSGLDGIHPDDRPLSRATYRRQQANLATDVVLRILRPDGEMRWVRAQSYPLPPGATGDRRMVGVIRDISDAKQSSERLREQAALLDLAQDAIIVLDVEHRVTYWNASAERLYGWTASEANGKTVADLQMTDSAEQHQAFAVVMREGEWAGPLSQRSKTDQRLVVQSRWSLVRDAAGQPTSVLVINTDITAQQLLEQQFLRAQRLESIGVLAGGIAHDLNNVLTPVTLGAEMLTENLPEGPDRAIASTILSSAKRGRDMVAQVLAFARGVEGQSFAIKPVELLNSLEKISRDSFPKNVEIRVSAGEVPWTVVGDETQLHQVLLNLCVNARDAMQDGGRLTVTSENRTVSRREAARHLNMAPGSYVVFSVTDTGTGIAPGILDRMFDPFFTTKNVGHGTGLGLSTAMTIVKNHGGTMEVTSEVGQGSTFRVFLPARVGVAPVAESSERPRGSGETVLVVDDEPSILHVAKLTLQRQGYRVLLAARGDEAVSLYRQHSGSVAVVVTDMMMPGLDGRATIAAMRQLNAAVRIVACSGVPIEDMGNSDSHPSMEFLPKPYSAEALLNALRRTLARPS